MAGRIARQTTADERLLVNDEHRAGRVRKYRRGNAAQQVPDDSGATVSAQDDHAHVVFLGGLNNPAPRRCGLHNQTLRPKSRVSRESRSERRGLVCGLTDLARYGRVKVALGDRLKADIGKLPYAQSERVATGRELAARALDG